MTLTHFKDFYRRTKVEITGDETVLLKSEFFTCKTVWTREKKKALFVVLVKIIQCCEYYSCCDWSSPSEVLECRHMDDVTVNLFCLFCSTWRMVLKMFVSIIAD